MNKLEAVFFDLEKAAFLYGIIKENENGKRQFIMDHQKLMQELIDFRNSRGWDEAHSLPNLAKSVNIEAAEILEIFQWKKTSDELSEDEKTHLKGEIADTLIYLFYMCDRLNVDPMDTSLSIIREEDGIEENLIFISMGITL